MVTRTDMEERLPIVYNGKSAEEWYVLYCQSVLKLNQLRQHIEDRINIIQRDRNLAMAEGKKDVVEDTRAKLTELRFIESLIILKSPCTCSQRKTK